MWTTLISWGMGLFPNLKNIIIGILCVLLITAVVSGYFKDRQVESRDKTIAMQASDLKEKMTEIHEQKVQIDALQANIQNIKAAQVAMQKIQAANKKLKVQIAQLSKEKDNGQETRVYSGMFDFFASSGVSSDMSGGKTD